MRIPRLTALVFVVAMLTHCAAANVGPQVTLEETMAVYEAAKYSGAAEKSPYEFFAAEQYLAQAEREMARGRPELASRYLQKAHEFSELAYKNAKKFRKIHLK
ncbi:DUF4398 domain-containing protein [bacterium]|nr:DUF4398 domain-containing protein [bacterium]